MLFFGGGVAVSFFVAARFLVFGALLVCTSSSVRVVSCASLVGEFDATACGISVSATTVPLFAATLPSAAGVKVDAAPSSAGAEVDVAAGSVDATTGGTSGTPAAFLILDTLAGDFLGFFSVIIAVDAVLLPLFSGTVPSAADVKVDVTTGSVDAAGAAFGTPGASLILDAAGAEVDVAAGATFGITGVALMLDTAGTEVDVAVGAVDAVPSDSGAEVDVAAGAVDEAPSDSGAEVNVAAGAVDAAPSDSGAEVDVTGGATFGTPPGASLVVDTLASDFLGFFSVIITVGAALSPLVSFSATAPSTFGGEVDVAAAGAKVDVTSAGTGAAVDVTAAGTFGTPAGASLILDALAGDFVGFFSVIALGAVVLSPLLTGTVPSAFGAEVDVTAAAGATVDIIAGATFGTTLVVSLTLAALARDFLGVFSLAGFSAARLLLGDCSTTTGGSGGGAISEDDVETVSSDPCLEAFRVLMVSLRLGSCTVNSARAVVFGDAGGAVLSSTSCSGSRDGTSASFGSVFFSIFGSVFIFSSCCKGSPASCRRRNSLNAAAL